MRVVSHLRIDHFLYIYLIDISKWFFFLDFSMLLLLSFTTKPNNILDTCIKTFSDDTLHLMFPLFKNNSPFDSYLEITQYIVNVWLQFKINNKNCSFE